ncbi:NADH-quinone oxidoreductase subunit I [Bacteroidales bacterium]|nr:NADH-quinone oxidoreductase subunit I [Bacteroidales bacterium]
MRDFIAYIKGIVMGIYNLMQGMRITMRNMRRPKVTESYPENRETRETYERFRGALEMPHNENNKHKCTACMICMNNCPNGTIQIKTKMLLDEDTGKEKKVLDTYFYDLGSCIFCDLCTQTCPQDAISWSQNFEHSMFTRAKLNTKLNHEGSSLLKKEKKEVQN